MRNRIRLPSRLIEERDVVMESHQLHEVPATSHRLNQLLIHMEQLVLRRTEKLLERNTVTWLGSQANALP
jgi:hypothetical protein